jgi:hypothetical protein
LDGIQKVNASLGINASKIKDEIPIHQKLKSNKRKSPMETLCKLKLLKKEK